ncbi:MAG TPA: BadF/BadG/BcrA/BcrD ATPase family protein [bacterium]|nr:BadF/BadG/BcrA/BcrD ATPase family protein [bacterium]HPG82286.1 BadF/BadG/BcrA/BcrD ATPase family protein [bacterium]HPM58143.1 BadF/BadG/BcrA/BcrD ATPase family protein [bacterium]
MAKRIIGLDGGGTKTLGVMIDENGRLLARATGDSSNIQAIGAERLGESLAGLIAELVAIAGCRQEEVDHLYAGLAGAGRPADREAISAQVTSRGLARAHTIDTDASAALAGAFGGGPGIIVISGTGSICFGKDEKGTLYRCGGWGFKLGDEGSGYYIGQQALMAALKDLDGRGPETVLRGHYEKRYHLASIDLIISQIYSDKIDRTEIASNAPAVFAAAQEGDAAARQIIESAGREIGRLVAGAAKRMGREGGEVAVALIGSIFNQRDVLMPFMREEALKVVRSAEFIEPRFEPAIGSCIMGLQKEGVAVSPQLLANLEKALV